MSGASLKFSSEQLEVAERAAKILRGIAIGLPALEWQMGAADHGVHGCVGFGTTLDALVIHHFPEWRGGTATQPGMGRRQWSSIVIPDPLSANALAFPRYGVLRPNGRISVDD